MKKLNKLICKLFGCKMHEEVWANKNVRLRDMKEIIIRQQHPIIEGVERKSITVDEEKNCTVIVYGKKEEPKFKRGDIVSATYFGERFTLILREDYAISPRRVSCIAAYRERFNDVIMDSGIESLEWTPSTPEEKQRLFTALAKEGKRWNAETLELEDILRVSENIKIYQLDCLNNQLMHGDRLRIGFNNNTQLLGYDLGVYSVSKAIPAIKEVQCELIPCKREDLKAGDTAFSHLVNNASELAGYCKILGSSKGAYISDNCSVMVANWSVHPSLQWYKVVPIKE